MASNQERWEGTLEEAKNIFKTLEAQGWVPHIVKNKEGNNYHVFRHINCDWCAYCDVGSPTQEVDNPIQEDF